MSAVINRSNNHILINKVICGKIDIEIARLDFGLVKKDSHRAPIVAGMRKLHVSERRKRPVYTQIEAAAVVADRADAQRQLQAVNIKLRQRGF